MRGGPRKRQFWTVRKLPSGRWQARYRDGSGKMFPAPSTFPTKTDATRFLAEMEADKGRGTRDQSSRFPTQPRTRVTPGSRSRRRAAQRSPVLSGRRAMIQTSRRQTRERAILRACETGHFPQRTKRTARSRCSGLSVRGKRQGGFGAASPYRGCSAWNVFRDTSGSSLQVAFGT